MVEKNKITPSQFIVKISVLKRGTLYILGLIISCNQEKPGYKVSHSNHEQLNNYLHYLITALVDTVIMIVIIPLRVKTQYL